MSARKVKCTVQAITDHGFHVYTLELAPQRPAPPFKPGQFLHLSIHPYDAAGFWPESRVFSIASSPRTRDTIVICYSVKGYYTTQMERQLRVGSEVWIKLPSGTFFIDEARPAVLLAGGTGISAFTAFIAGLSPDHQQPVHLMYGVRLPHLLLFEELITARMNAVPKLEVTIHLEQDSFRMSEAPVPTGRQPRWCRGSIALEPRWGLFQQMDKPVFYISGPPSLVTAMKEDLAARGVPDADVRTDAW